MDRTVHAIAADGGEVVRYDRAGKWYLEYGDSARRRELSLNAAASLARRPGAQMFTGRPGGRSFDAKVRAHA